MLFLFFYFLLLLLLLLHITQVIIMYWWFLGYLLNFYILFCLLITFQSLLIVHYLGVVVSQSYPCCPTFIIYLQNLLIIIKCFLILVKFEVEFCSKTVTLLKFIIITKCLVDSLYGLRNIINLIISHWQK